MATEVNLPALGESVTEGTVTRWLKQVGDDVAVDEPLLEVSTDKVDTEIPSPVAGKLLEIKANEDDTVEVGAVLAVIGDEGESGGDGGGETADAGEQEESEPEQQEEPAEEPQQEEPQQEEAPAAQEQEAACRGVGRPVRWRLGRWFRYVGDPARARRVRHRGHRHPLAQAGRRRGRGRRAAARGLHRQGRHRDPLPGGRHPARDQGRRGRDRRGRRRAGRDRFGRRGSAQESAPQAEEPKAEEKPAEPEPEEEPAEQPQAEQPKAEEKPAEPKQPEPQQEAPKQEADRSEASSYVTPLVRKMAAQHDVDLSTVTGTGVGGRIRKQDVLDAAQARQQAQPAPAEQAAPAAAAPAAASGAPAVTPSPLRGKTEPLSRLRKVIAKRMVESLQSSAQLTTVVEVDVTAIARLRDSVKAEFAAREGVKLSFLPFFAKAAIDALKQHPSLNAAIDTEKGEVTYYDEENLAIAVDTEKGLLTPVIKDAGDLSIAGLARKIADVAERTRSNKITPDELSGGTFTLTNTGSRGALFDTPIINQPQVAILGTGSIVKRPVVIDDPNLGETIAVRQMVYLALTYDHRLVDGADAARFLTEVKQRLEAGQFEV